MTRGYVVSIEQFKGDQMRAASGRRVAMLFFASVLAVTASGCAVGFRGFSMDSVSRMPFFGFEIKERKTKSNAPVYNSISYTEYENARIEPAIQTETAPPRNFLNLGLKNPFNTKGNSSSAGGSKRPDQAQTSISIPLTMTEGAKTSLDRASNQSVIDFQ